MTFVICFQKGLVNIIPRDKLLDVCVDFFPDWLSDLLQNHVCRPAQEV